jgi:peptidyl-dipeptidase A
MQAIMKKQITQLLFLITIFTIGCTNKNIQMEKKLKDFIARHDSVVIPLFREANLAYWDASISGKDSDYVKLEELQKKYTLVFSSKEDFQQLKTFKESGAINDSLLKRQLTVLYNAYIPYQVDTAKLNKIISLSTLIEKKYSNYRAEVNGKKYSDNEIEEILSTSTDNKELEVAWKAHKKIGPVVESDIRELVKLRNEVAKDLGFDNFHQMSLTVLEQDPREIEKLFDELDSLTRNTFLSLKGEIDAYLSKHCNIDAMKLQPWNYQNRFFQEAPKIYTVDLDKYYKDKNLEILTSEYYNGLGIPIGEILAKSDLYEKPGKNQHAYCTDIDKAGDVRVLCNIKPNYSWMETMLHEFGHATYFKYIDPSLTFTLHDPAHIFTTEAIAMLFGRMSANPQWIQDMTGITNDEKNKIADDCFKMLRLKQIVFSRWTQVMYRFEKGMYENPDADLNSLWWSLVEKYQFIKKPEGRNEPDWASKIHIATAPCYYHNYMLGELLASQLNHYIAANIFKTDSVNNLSYCNSLETGTFLKDKIFAPGNKYGWNEMIEMATGEKLTARYYAEQYVK